MFKFTKLDEVHKYPTFPSQTLIFKGDRTREQTDITHNLPQMSEQFSSTPTVTLSEF